MNSIWMAIGLRVLDLVWPWAHGRSVRRVRRRNAKTSKRTARIARLGAACALVACLGGCAYWDRAVITVGEIVGEKPDEPPTPPPEPPPEPASTWRRDVATVQAVDGAIEFRTRGITRPGGDGLNRDGGFEWIVARIHGGGFGRLLIMVMGGNRNPSRLYLDGAEINGTFAVPMEREAAWRVEAPDGRLRILLDGREIWRDGSGGRTVTHGVMHGYPNRESTGEWRQ